MSTTRRLAVTAFSIIALVGAVLPAHAWETVTSPTPSETPPDQSQPAPDKSAPPGGDEKKGEGQRSQPEQPAKSEQPCDHSDTGQPPADNAAGQCGEQPSQPAHECEAGSGQPAPG